MHPADANIEIGGIAPSGPSEVQAGVQHSHQHPLAGKSGLPGAAQTHQVVAVAVGALLGEGARLFNGPVVHMLYVGAFHPVHGLDFSQTAIGDFHGHCVDQIGPLGDQLHILAHGGQQIALGLLELRLSVRYWLTASPAEMPETEERSKPARTGSSVRVTMTVTRSSG